MFATVPFIPVGLAVLGGLSFTLVWYSSFLGNIWAQFLELDVKKGKISDLSILLASIIVSFISTSILYAFMSLSDKGGLLESIEFVYLLWFGFVLPFGMLGVIVKKASLSATAIELLGFLGQLLVSGIILAYFI